jgi:uncharacterized protein YebE (UPF0316 family)
LISKIQSSIQNVNAYLGRAVLGHVANLTAVLALHVATTGSTRLGAVTDVVTILVAVGASHLELLDLLNFLRAVLLGVTNLIAVAADGDHLVHGEAGILKTLRVLLRSLGPAFSKEGAARLQTLLDGDLVSLACVTLQVDVGVDSGSDELLLGDEVVAEVGLTEALLKLRESELRGNLAVDPESLDKVVDITRVIGVDEVVPSSVTAGDIRQTGRVDGVLFSAVGSIVADLVALAADGLRAGSRAVALLTAGTALDSGALGTTVALLATVAAFSGEGTVDGLVGTIGLVVTSLATVEALSRVLARLSALGLVVTGLTAVEAAIAIHLTLFGAGVGVVTGLVAAVVEHMSVRHVSKGEMG